MKSKILGLLAVGLLAGPMTAQAMGVVVDGIEWRQLTETRGLSYDLVATVCSTADGVCSGSIGATSFDGWTWASISDIQGLFEQLIQPGSIQFPDIKSYYRMANDPDIDAAIGPGAFTSMQEPCDDCDFEDVVGFSRTTLAGWFPEPEAAEWAWAPLLVNVFANDIDDGAYLGGNFFRTSGSFNAGIWLFRVASNTEPVPEPGTLALLGFGLAGLRMMRRRRAN